MKRLCTIVVAGCLLAACSHRPPADAGKPAPPSPAQVRAEAEQAWQFGDHASALARWQRLLELAPDDVAAWHGIGEAYLALGEASAALAAFDAVLARQPADAAAQEGRALALLGLDRHAEARAALAALATGGEAWRVQNALGLLADLDGRYDAAQLHYRQALTLQPENAVVRNNLGYSCLMARDYVQAERHFRDGLAQAPGSARLHANLVLALAWQGEYARALTVALEQQPREVALNNIGYVALLRRDYDAAIRHFEAALEASPRWYVRAAANLERARQERDAARRSETADGASLGSRGLSPG